MVKDIIFIKDVKKLERCSGIYAIVNKINGKLYIGSAVNIYDRIVNRHIRLLNLQEHHNINLQRSWVKFTSDNFYFKIIEKCNENKLIEREQYWIDQFDFKKELYNLCPTAGSSLGIKRSEEFKAKLKGNKNSLGKKNSLGNKHSEETKQRMKEAKNISNGAKAAKSVIQFDKTHNIIKIYPSVMEAHRKTGIPQCSISLVCRNKLKSAGGYLWKFEKDYKESI